HCGGRHIRPRRRSFGGERPVAAALLRLLRARAGLCGASASTGRLSAGAGLLRAPGPVDARLVPVLQPALRFVQSADRLLPRLRRRLSFLQLIAAPAKTKRPAPRRPFFTWKGPLEISSLLTKRTVRNSA